MKIILYGCNGKMGRAITEFVRDKEGIEIAAGVDIVATQQGRYPVYPKLNDVTESADIIFDFTRAENLDDVLDYALANGLPVLLATTGYDDVQRARIDEAARDIAIFNTPNLSIGVYVMTQVAAQIAKRLEDLTLSSGAEPYDIEIIEKHHNRKLDAPSGTALSIVNAIKDNVQKKCECVYDRHDIRQRREGSEIGVHSIRGGTIIGEHSVIFAGNNELIEVTHKSESSLVFASGALTAARFLLKQPHGLYGMRDLVDC